MCLWARDTCALRSTVVYVEHGGTRGMRWLRGKRVAFQSPFRRAFSILRARRRTRAPVTAANQKRHPTHSPTRNIYHAFTSFRTRGANRRRRRANVRRTAVRGNESATGRRRAQWYVLASGRSGRAVGTAWSTAVRAERGRMRGECWCTHSEETSGGCEVRKYSEVRKCTCKPMRISSAPETARHNPKL